MSTTSQVNNGSSDPPSADALSLLQSIRKWTHKHLEAARLNATKVVPISDIIPAEFIPEDGDSGMYFYIPLPFISIVSCK